MNSDPSAPIQSDQFEADQQGRHALAAISCLGALLCIAAIAVAITYYVVVLGASTTTLLPSLGASSTPQSPTLEATLIATQSSDASGLPPAQWPIVYSDSFDSNINDWPDYSFSDETQSATHHVRDGKYMWDVKLLPGSYGFGWGLWPTSSQSVSDFYASVEAKVTGQIIDATYGLTFRNNEAGYYFFGLNDQGLFTVEAIIYNQSNNILIKPTETSAFQSGETNRLTVVAVGSHLAFYLNDRLVAELDDETFPGGMVGLAANLSGEDAQAQVEFDNVELRTPDETSGASAYPTHQPTAAAATEPPPIHDTDLPQTQWPLVLFDSFDTNDNDWPNFSDLSGTEPETFDVRNGKYVWSVQSDPGSLGVGWPFWAGRSSEVSDFYASVEANVTGEIKDATYGLVFRHSDTGHYFFGLNDQGLFTVEAIIYNQSNNILIKPTETSAVQSGEANRLSVVAIGSHLKFHINDQLVAELDDDSLQRGFVGVYVGLVGGEALAEVEFDNFELRAP